MIGLNPLIKPSYQLRGVSKEVILLLKNHPSCFEESVIHFFLKGGTIKTANLFREMGYKSNNDLKIHLGLYSERGQNIDTLYENELFTGVMVRDECNDFINDFVEFLNRYPTKGKMQLRLLELNTVPF